MPPVSLEQIRARRAYAAVAEHQHHGIIEWAERLPVMLQTNGLLATWAHLLDKAQKEEGAERILGIVLAHLQLPEQQAGQIAPRDAFLGWIGEGADQLTGARLRHLTEEVLALAAWLKRAAQAAGGD